MARYIDADALYEKLYPLDLVDKRLYTINAKAVADAIAKIPTADVVPKSEVMELSGKYEDLKLKYADLQRNHDELLAWGGHIKSTERAEIEKAVARAIFEEIEKLIYSKCFSVRGDRDVTGLIMDGEMFAKLKKKYTEGASEIPKKDFFTPEDVRKMSPKEVRQNYQAIMNSMKEW